MVEKRDGGARDDAVADPEDELLGPIPQDIKKFHDRRTGLFLLGPVRRPRVVARAALVGARRHRHVLTGSRGERKRRGRKPRDRKFRSVV